ncbi:MAG: signal peptidase II [Zoogloeaceae bacterium]|jgi:signal peptidase II|nr:signal peptidase II [Zoogloeaceae bacterium]
MSSRRWFLLALGLILVDQLTKLVVRAVFAMGEKLPVTGFFNLTLAYNPGAAFSFLADAGGWQKFFFAALALGISAWIAVQLYRHPEKRLQNLALALIMGGAIGNVIDRFAYGAVVDFLDFYIGQLHWPAFNFADSGITVGAVLLVLAEMKKT